MTVLYVDGECFRRGSEKEKDGGRRGYIWTKGLEVRNINTNRKDKLAIVLAVRCNQIVDFINKTSSQSEFQK